MPLAGALVRASDVRNPVMIRKGASQSVTSDDTVNNDNDIAISLDVGTWIIDLWKVVHGPAAGDVAVTWSNTGTMSVVHRSGAGPGNNTTDTRNTDSVQRGGMVVGTVPAYGVDGNADLTRASRIHEHLVVEVTVAGVITLRWAQSVSTASATTSTTATHALYYQVDEV